MKLTKLLLKQIIKEELQNMEEAGLGYRRQATELEPRLQSTSQPLSHHNKYGAPPPGRKYIKN